VALGRLPEPKPTLPSNTLKFGAMILRLWLDCNSHNLANDVGDSLHKPTAIDTLAESPLESFDVFVCQVWKRYASEAQFAATFLRRRPLIN